MQMILPFFKKREISDWSNQNFCEISHYLGLKINNAKCEIADIGVKKEVKMALWNGMYWFNEHCNKDFR